ncbi:hypothetical protein GCM10025867_19580 [Frondihabitans sucicola]|uniref:Uncharacterized protein n=1 Tax=Frondihabitans sucicola TaxID=1268041 RepID=A0ABN6XXF4_9MICO|nr:hypothetical protein [Frondihabitans sucicola]BDZ49717.1 hypothetical protein GCM10025867_19580 [Frondihabitans sucicola]
MFTDSAGYGFVVGGLVAYIVIAALAIFIGYLIIRTAILRALNSHYKTVRLFERTGQWEPRYQGNRKPHGSDTIENS